MLAIHVILVISELFCALCAILSYIDHDHLHTWVTALTGNIFNSIVYYDFLTCICWPWLSIYIASMFTSSYKAIIAEPQWWRANLHVSNFPIGHDCLSLLCLFLGHYSNSGRKFLAKEMAACSPFGGQPSHSTLLWYTKNWLLNSFLQVRQCIYVAVYLFG